MKREEEIRSAREQLIEELGQEGSQGQNRVLGIVCDVLQWVIDDSIAFHTIWKYLPDLSLADKALLGSGHYPDPGRYVINIIGKTWPHTPDTCLTDKYKCEWIDEHTLVCQGCGLDCT
jgi:hypothetical protein